jgi:protein gp37
LGNKSAIEWTDATWNPWHGCHKISPGCKFCYMYREKKQYGQDPNLVVRSKTKFYDPLKWKEPRLIFTCSWSDWFIEEADAWRDEAWDIIRRTPQHTYQILTKRIDRAVHPLTKTAAGRIPVPALPNVWLGVSVEDRERLSRIDLLRQTPAAVRFLSLEPLLEDLGPLDLRGIDWVIVGGESGPGARPMHPAWARSIRDQCVAAEVPFFFKQWGEWAPPTSDALRAWWVALSRPTRMGPRSHEFGDGDGAVRVGKKSAGRLLDGREWNEMPRGRYGREERTDAARS